MTGEAKKSIQIGLAGNPNSGKTTLFNALTGSNQYVGNWPGVTVEKKEGRLSNSFAGRLSSEYDVITVVDLPGIYSLSPYSPEEVVSRGFLTEGHPDVIINIIDGSNLERSLYLTTQLNELSIPLVVAVNMMDVVKKQGDRIDIKKLSAMLGCPVIEMSALREDGIREVAETAVSVCGQKKRTQKKIFAPETEEAIAQIIKLLDGKVPDELKRWYAVKIFERDEKIANRLAIDAEEIIKPLEMSQNDDSESIIINERYIYISKAVGACYIKRITGDKSLSEKIDSVMTNKFLALPVFAAIMFIIYYISVTTVGGYLTGFISQTVLGDRTCAFLSSWLLSLGTAELLVNLIVDGIIGGVGSVLSFTPQLLLLFFFLSALEECGYMSRIAFIMDRIFRRFGLSGKSFIPLLIGTGCSVPGIMSSRTIENDQERRMTIMTASFIPCGAKLPVIALIAGAFFGGAWWVAPSAYFLGIASVAVSGIILKKTRLFSGDPSPFIMELPAYRRPQLKSMLRSTLDRGMAFINKAGTIILTASIVIWMLSHFGFADGTIIRAERMDESILALIGSFIAPLFSPLGFGSWQASVAVIMGLIAKEEIVGVFGVIGTAKSASASINALMTPVSAYSFLTFNLLCVPCVAAVGAIRQEMKSMKWTFFTLGYQTVFAYAASFIIYRFGLLFAGGGFDYLTFIAIVPAAVIASMMIMRKERKIER